VCVRGRRGEVVEVLDTPFILSPGK